MARWLCQVCGYVYDESLGEKDTGTQPGTRFDEFPADWKCPICGSGKEVFVMLGEGPPAARTLSPASPWLR
jgi:rubredoxin